MAEKSFEEMRLEWDEFYWLGNSEFDCGIELHISTEDEEKIPPHTEQLNAWVYFTENYPSIKTEISKAIYKYYNRMRPQYLSAGGDWAKNMPEITSVNDIDDMIKLNYICLSWPYNNSEVQLGLNYSCLWDNEHGLGVVLEGCNVKDVGSADCAIL